MLPSVATLDTYGGQLDNYRPVTDPTTDRDAAMMNEALADVAGLTNTGARAWCRVTINTTTGGMAIVEHRAVWGSAPGVAPTPARSSQGIFTLTWPATVTDALGATQSVSFLGALGPNVRTTDEVFANVSSIATNVVTFAVWNALAALRADGPYDVDIWVL